jgi:hypothetical protein
MTKRPSLEERLDVVAKEMKVDSLNSEVSAELGRLVLGAKSKGKRVVLRNNNNYVIVSKFFVARNAGGIHVLEPEVLLPDSQLVLKDAIPGHETKIEPGEWYPELYVGDGVFVVEANTVGEVLYKGGELEMVAGSAAVSLTRQTSRAVKTLIR